MKSVVNSKKREQYKKFMAKDAAFLKKIVGGEGGTSDNTQDSSNKIKL